ncbi:MAG: MotA/TolQ/ExbB proton channel family protein [Gammaproteobacteria bacterium]|nr:MotA/TolQ/ExbB proton channel family protein [Gammaproteobacteria bacterium]
MMRRLKWFLILLFAAFSPLQAEEPVKPNSLDELLKKVQTIANQESATNKQRETTFLQQKNQQQRLLDEAKQDLKKEQARSDKLKSQFNANEKKLAELEKELHLRMGSLGELFGVVKQVAGDTKGVFDNSLVSAQITNRQALLKDLAQRKAIPASTELEQLWFLIQQEIVESGKVVRFPTQVVMNNGKSKDTQVTRVGVFNAVSDGKFVRYIPETSQIVELPRQPASNYVDAATELENAKSGTVNTVIDPSRGAILSMLIQVPGLFERIQQGKLIGYIILALTIVGLIVAAERFIKLFITQNRINAQLEQDVPSTDNPLGRVITVYRQNPRLDIEILERKLDEAIIKELPGLERGVALIKVLAVIAPLLGLLGTVTGMIETFQSITLFGTGDPKLMAGGISQALVTTVLGLTAAIPLIFLHSLVNARSKRCINILEEQSAGMVAAHAESTAG